MLLASSDFEKPFVLQTDTSEHRIGAVLSQRDAVGCDHPIAYFSRKPLPRGSTVLHSREGVSGHQVGHGNV